MVRGMWRSLAEINRAMAAGEQTCAGLVEAALGRAEAVEGWLRSFAWLDPQRARSLAAGLDRRAQEARREGRPLGALHGVPIGVKDIVDTAGVPTEHGSALFAGRVPDASAEVVRNLEGAGGLMLGKTVTAEMAYFHPGPTVNPWDRERTPGGSSMGSAAAVAAGIVPGAVGTQTNGSVIRPAAFCGVVGFKPSAGRLSRQGMLTFSETLDQPGTFTRSVADAAWLVAALAGDPLDRWWGSAGEPAPDTPDTPNAPGPGGAAPRLALAPTSEWAHAGPAQRERFEQDVAALRRAGARIDEVLLPPGLDPDPAQAEPEREPDAPPVPVLAVHRTIMAYEGAQALEAVVAQRPQLVSETLRRFLAEGAAVPEAEYRAALDRREVLRERFARWAAPFDAVLSPPATGEAPGLDTTGDPRFCTRWTLVGAPALVLPSGRGPHGLPLGLQLIGAQGQDRRLLQAAAWVERVLTPLGPPPPPGP
jgi:Asp-tRNA(Asn)/Glu-tRNA(Gln) amidotransferase A subunit family amidase